jgi:hypothetical protein
MPRSMAETLLVWSNLYAGGEAQVRERLAGKPVLVFAPPELALGGSVADRQLRTDSGVSAPAFGGGAPMAAVVEKTRENVFKARITVGRTGNNDLKLDDPSVSRFHAWLEPTDEAWVLVDAGSRNGTFVAGRRLAARAPARLANAAAVRVGGVPLTFFTAQGFLQFLEQRTQGK